MLTHLKNKLQALKSFSFEGELKKIVEINKDKLADLQATQLYTGRDVNGEPITLNGRGYSHFTIKQKQKKGQVTDRIVWRDTGELYKSLKAEIKGSVFAIKSNNFKFQSLLKRSGEKTIGLNIDSRREFVSEITRPSILKVYKEKVTDV